MGTSDGNEQGLTLKADSSYTVDPNEVYIQEFKIVGNRTNL